ncbi:Neurogenic locus notch-like protein 2, partial [Exaiptasia diaphana]
ACEHSSCLNPCKSSPCAKGGSCKFHAKEDYRCICTPGYQGNRCQEDINECTTKTHTCDTDYGDCVNTIGSYVCNCKTGLYFNGTKCIRYQYRGLGNSSI